MCQPLFIPYLHCLERKAMKHCLARGRLSIFEKLSPGNKLQIPNSEFQRSTNLQAQKPTCAPFAPCICFCGWCFEAWNFSGAWGLVFGVSLGGGSNTEMCPSLDSEGSTGRLTRIAR